jgi:hypothetical protein
MTDDFNARVHRFANWLKAGGLDTVWDMKMIDEIAAMKQDIEGNVVPESVGPLARSFMNALELGQSYGPPHRVGETYLYPSLDRKGVMFKQINIDTKEDLERIIAEELGRSKIIYRGMREAKWPLYTSLQRTWMTEKLPERGQEVGDFLKQLVHNARVAENGAIPEYLRRRGHGYETDMAILSFIQHYGGATPMQDWTYNFLNALYFAIDKLETPIDPKDIEAYCSVYHIEQEHIEDGNIKSYIEHLYNTSALDQGKEIVDQSLTRGIDMATLEGHLKSGTFTRALRRTYTRLVGSLDGLAVLARNIPLVFMSDQDATDAWDLVTTNNNNIVNQQGVFIWNSHPSEPVENVARELHERDHGWTTEYRFCHCYNINKELRDDIEQVLQKQSVVERHIYPEVPMLFGSMSATQIVQEVVQLTKDNFRNG